jgi:hypothetical protein
MWMWMWTGERAGVHHNFTLICLLLFRVNGIREAKHLSHIFGTLGVNLTYIYSICPSIQTPSYHFVRTWESATFGA